MRFGPHMTLHLTIKFGHISRDTANPRESAESNVLVAKNRQDDRLCKAHGQAKNGSMGMHAVRSEMVPRDEQQDCHLLVLVMPIDIKRLNLY